jgi:hypothetical protein
VYCIFSWLVAITSLTIMTYLCPISLSSYLFKPYPTTLGTAGDHKGPPIHSTPRSPLRTGACGRPGGVTGMPCGRPDWYSPADTTYLLRQLAFHDQRYALTSTNTQRCQAVVRLTTLHFVKQRDQYTCAACPNWMTQGNRTTVYVELGPVEP